MSRLEGETGARAGGGFSPQQTLTLVARAAFPGGKKGPSQYKGSVRSKLCSQELISSPSRADSLLLFPVHSGGTHRLRLVLCHPTCCQRESVFHASDISVIRGLHLGPGAVTAGNSDLVPTLQAL